MRGWFVPLAGAVEHEHMVKLADAAFGSVPEEPSQTVSKLIADVSGALGASPMAGL